MLSLCPLLIIICCTVLDSARLLLSCSSLILSVSAVFGVQCVVKWMLFNCRQMLYNLSLINTFDNARLSFNSDHFPHQDTRVANLALGIGQEERFFNKLEDDVSRIVQREKRREQYTNSQGQEVNTSTEHEPVSGRTRVQTKYSSCCLYSASSYNMM